MLVDNLVLDVQRADPDDEGGRPQHAALPHVCLIHLHRVGIALISLHTLIDHRLQTHQ